MDRTPQRKRDSGIVNLLHHSYTILTSVEPRIPPLPDFEARDTKESSPSPKAAQSRKKAFSPKSWSSQAFGLTRVGKKTFGGSRLRFSARHRRPSRPHKHNILNKNEAEAWDFCHNCRAPPHGASSQLVKTLCAALRVLPGQKATSLSS